MRTETRISRVGVLAAAVVLGAALAIGCPVAAAEPSSSSPGSSSSSSGSSASSSGSTSSSSASSSSSSSSSLTSADSSTGSTGSSKRAHASRESTGSNPDNTNPSEPDTRASSPEGADEPVIEQETNAAVARPAGRRPTQPRTRTASSGSPQRADSAAGPEPIPVAPDAAEPPVATTVPAASSNQSRDACRRPDRQRVAGTSPARRGQHAHPGAVGAPADR